MDGERKGKLKDGDGLLTADVGAGVSRLGGKISQPRENPAVGGTGRCGRKALHYTLGLYISSSLPS